MIKNTKTHNPFIVLSPDIYSTLDNLHLRNLNPKYREKYNLVKENERIDIVLSMK